MTSSTCSSGPTSRSTRCSSRSWPGASGARREPVVPPPGAPVGARRGGHPARHPPLLPAASARGPVSGHRLRDAGATGDREAIQAPARAALRCPHRAARRRRARHRAPAPHGARGVGRAGSGRPFRHGHRPRHLRFHGLPARGAIAPRPGSRGRPRCAALARSRRTGHRGRLRRRGVAPGRPTLLRPGRAAPTRRRGRADPPALGPHRLRGRGRACPRRPRRRRGGAPPVARRHRSHGQCLAPRRAGSGGTHAFGPGAARGDAARRGSGREAPEQMGRWPGRRAGARRWLARPSHHRHRERPGGRGGERRAAIAPGGRRQGRAHGGALAARPASLREREEIAGTRLRLGGACGGDGRPASRRAPRGRRALARPRRAAGDQDTSSGWRPVGGPSPRRGLLPRGGALRTVVAGAPDGGGRRGVREGASLRLRRDHAPRPALAGRQGGGAGLLRGERRRPVRGHGGRRRPRPLRGGDEGAPARTAPRREDRGGARDAWSGGEDGAPRRGRLGSTPSSGSSPARRAKGSSPCEPTGTCSSSRTGRRAVRA